LPEILVLVFDFESPPSLPDEATVFCSTSAAAKSVDSEFLLLEEILACTQSPSFPMVATLPLMLSGIYSGSDKGMFFFEVLLIAAVSVLAKLCMDRLDCLEVCDRLLEDMTEAFEELRGNTGVLRFFAMDLGRHRSRLRTVPSFSLTGGPGTT